MMKLGALLGWWPLVWLRSDSGFVYLERATQDPWGDWHAFPTSWQFVLQKNGKARYSQYTEWDWKEWPHNRKHLAWEREDEAA